MKLLTTIKSTMVSTLTANALTVAVEHKNRVLSAVLALIFIYLTVAGIAAASMTLADINDGQSRLSFLDHTGEIQKEINDTAKTIDKVGIIVTGIIVALIAVMLTFSTISVFWNYSQFNGGVVYFIIKLLSGIASGCLGVYLFLLLTVFPLPGVSMLMSYAALSSYLGLWCYHTNLD